MTEDLNKLIEDIKRANRTTLQRIIQDLATPDPIERFKKIELWDPSLNWAAPRAKAITLQEIRNSEPFPSLKDVGLLLGISAQRVHQLANPTSGGQQRGIRKSRRN